MRAIHLTAFGNPSDRLQLVNVPEPPPPGPGQVLLGIEYSPVNMSDLLIARGTFPIRPKLPGPIGNEGVGRVLAVGAGVSHVKVGDRALAPLFSFTWVERMLVPAAGLIPLPPDADVQQLSMLAINPPTAALLLSEYTALEPGDWVVQNAANSGVGRSVIAWAKARGLKTVNLVRRPELVRELADLGGDLNFVDAPDVAEQARTALRQAAPRLALDGVGGASTATLAAIVGRDATIAVYSAMSHEPLSIGPLDVIGKNLSVRGFFLGAPQYAAKIPQAIREGAELIRTGKLHAPVAATYPLSAIRDAIAHAERGGKVLLQVAQ